MEYKTNADVSPTEHFPNDDEDRLARILDEYMAAAEQGTPISPAELLERFPEEADRLREYLSGLRLFDAAAFAAPRPQAASTFGRVPELNQTIGDFHLLRQIGRGGMGVVFEAEQISLGRRVAVKILPFAAPNDAKRIERFKNEAQAAAHVQHPNIVPIYAIGEDGGVHFYSMQLIEGQSVATILAELRSGGAAWNEPSGAESTPSQRSNGRTAGGPSASRFCDHLRAVARMGIQAAEALHAAHEYGIVHRDVKPSNLLVDDQGKLWVTDFGLARFRERANITQTGELVGTMRYMSPEQAIGGGQLVDHRTDVYSLGVTLYELATLHHPAGDAADATAWFDRARFRHKPMRHWRRNVPIDFETIVMKAISESPQERYATAQELADDLDRFIEGKPILASRPGIVTRAGKWMRRHRKVVYAAGAALLLAFVGQSYNALLLARSNAEKEQALADKEKHLQHADASLRKFHAVLDRFGTRLVDQLAAIPGAEGVRYQLLEDSLGLYQDFEAQAAGDPALRHELALAYSKMGGLGEKMGQSAKAIEQHQAARDVWKALCQQEPASAENRRNLALCENNIGLLLGDLGRSDEALAAFAEAERMQRGLLDANPAAAEVSADLAATYNNLGLLLRQCGRTKNASEKFSAAIALYESLARSDPNGEPLLRGLAAAYNNLGALDEQSANDASVDSYQQAITIQRRLAATHPTNRIYQGDLARTYNNLGYALTRKGDLANAEQCYSDAMKIQENLVKASPFAASYRRDLAISCSNLGMLMSRDRRFAEAEAAFLRSIEVQRSLAAADSSETTDARLMSNLGGALNNLALLYDQQLQFSDAETAYAEAIEWQRKAWASSPSTQAYRDMLSNHYANYTQCLRKQDKMDAAEAAKLECETLLARQQ